MIKYTMSSVKRLQECWNPTDNGREPEIDEFVDTDPKKICLVASNLKRRSWSEAHVAAR